MKTNIWKLKDQYQNKPTDKTINKNEETKSQGPKKARRIEKKKLDNFFSADTIDFESVDAEDSYIFFPKLLDDLPMTLNSYIALGIYFINETFIYTERGLSDELPNLSAHPNLKITLGFEDFQSWLRQNEHIYKTDDFIKILQRKFCKFIYFQFYVGQQGDVDNGLPKLFKECSLINIPENGIEPSNDYIILSSRLPAQKDESNTDDEDFKTNYTYVDSFKYCYHLIELYKQIKSDNIDEYIKYISDETYKYQLRWFIATESKSQPDGSIPFNNSQLFIRINKFNYLRISNNVMTQVTVDSIQSCYPRYFCYEKLPLNLQINREQFFK